MVVAIVLAACAPAQHTDTAAGSVGGVGSIRTDRMAAESDIAYEIDTGILTVIRQDWRRVSWRRTTTVIAMDADRIAQVEVTYLDHAFESSMSGTDGAVRERGPLAGKTYVVAVDGTRLAVTTGGPITPEEVALVRGDHRWMLRPDPITALSRAGLAVGDDVTLDEGVLAATVGGEPPDRFRGIARVRERIGPDQLVFDVEIAQSRDDDDDVTVGNRLAGTLIVQAGRARELSLYGPIRTARRQRDGGHMVAADGIGRAELHWTDQ